MCRGLYVYPCGTNSETKKKMTTSVSPPTPPPPFLLSLYSRVCLYLTNCIKTQFSLPCHFSHSIFVPPLIYFGQRMVLIVLSSFSICCFISCLHCPIIWQVKASFFFSSQRSSCHFLNHFFFQVLLLWSRCKNYGMTSGPFSMRCVLDIPSGNSQGRSQYSSIQLWVYCFEKV